MTQIFSNSGGIALADFATPITAKNHFIKASFGGFAGSGKSRTGSDFCVGAYQDMKCTKPILVIDNEKGSRFLIPFFEQHKIRVVLKDTTKLADIITAMQFLKDGEVDFLFVDSLTKVWYQYVRDYKEKNRVTFMTLQDWGKILPAWQEEFSDRFVDCPGNIVFTGRGGYTYEKEEDLKDDNGRVTKKGQFVKSGVKMKMAGETPFEPDINVWMELQQDVTTEGLEQWREAQILKDRSGLIDGKIFKNPTYDNFRPVVKYLLNVPVGEVAGTTNSANLAPSENFDSMERRKQKDIALETIEGILTEAYPSSSAAEKKHKVMSLEYAYKTKSWTAITSMSLEQINSGLALLREYVSKNPLERAA